MSDTTSLDRRSFLRGATLATAGLALGASVPLSAAPAPLARDRRTALGHPFPQTPQEALDRLMAGNERFVSGNTQGMNRDMARVAELSAGQSPFAAVLSCADSRVPPELLFDQGFGDLFTVRVAGNVVGNEELASLEYTVGVLGSQVLMVLGHTSCGAVGAAMQGGQVPGQISTLFTHITPAIEGIEDVNEAVEANVRQQVEVLRTSSPVMTEAVDAGNLIIVGGVYDLASGAVTVIDRGY